jgi:phage shock protein A
MTIDERLERLAERHEALTQTVELMMHQQREWHEDLQEWQRAMRDWQANADERQRKNEVLLAQVLESIDTLARIAHLHERRISGLEERPS